MSDSIKKNRVELQGRLSVMKAAFLGAILVGFITHLTLMILQPYCADPIIRVTSGRYYPYELYSYGRWAANLFFSIRGYIIVPALQIICVILDCALASALFVDIFTVRKKFNAFLIGAIVVVNPFVANVNIEYYMSTWFGFTIMMGALWVTYNTNIKIIWKFIINVIVVTICTGFYQSSFSMICCIAVLKLVFDLLTGKERKWKLFWLNFVSVCLGCVIYYAIWKILAHANNVTQFQGGANNYGVMNTLCNLPSSIKKIYINFWNMYFGNEIVQNTFWHRPEMVAALWLSTLAVAVILAKQHLSSGKITLKDVFLAGIMIILLPISTAPAFLIITEYNFYILTAHGFVFILPFSLVLADRLDIQNLKEKVPKLLISVLSVAIIWTLIWSDNAGYLLLNNTFKQTKELSSRLLTRIEDVDGFTYDMPVCFIGQPSGDAWNIDVIHFEGDTGLYEASSTGIFNQMGVWPGIWENSDGWGLFIYHFSGVKLNYYTNGMQFRIAELSETEQFKKAGCFPARDSVQIIDGTVVVKLGEVDYSGLLSQ